MGLSATGARLEVSREAILAHRRTVGALDERLPPGADSLRRAAWAGLSDSMPRAALLSIHARVAGTRADALADPSLVQLWGPRFSAYAVAAADRPVFTLGRLPASGARLRRAVDTAERVDRFLSGRTMPYGDVGRALGVHPNELRYGAPTGRILIDWDGARQPTIRTVPSPEMTPEEARLELARRFLHVFGTGTPTSFSDWAGVKPPAAQAAFDGLERSLVPVRTPVGDTWILGTDEASLRAPSPPAAGVRLLPSGDTFYLLQGADRALLVEDSAQRAMLWTTRVWPGAVFVDGEVAGTWRRADAVVTIQPWRRLADSARDAVQAEGESRPLPGLEGRIVVRWES